MSVATCQQPHLWKLGALLLRLQNYFSPRPFHPQLCNMAGIPVIIKMEASQPEGDRLTSSRSTDTEPQSGPNLLQSQHETEQHAPSDATVTALSSNATATEDTSTTQSAPNTPAVSPKIHQHQSDGKKASKNIVIRANGSLHINIGANTSPTTFIVSKTIVLSRCPTLIKSPIERSTSGEIETVALFGGYDYNTLALEIILLIAHGVNSQLPRSITFVTLVQLSRLAESHGLVKFVRPFVSRWLPPLLPHALSSEHNFWINLTCNFRLRELFLGRIEYAVNNARLVDSNLMLLETGDLMECLPEKRKTELYGESHQRQLPRKQKLTRQMQISSAPNDSLAYPSSQPYSKSIQGWQRGTRSLLVNSLTPTRTRS